MFADIVISAKSLAAGMNLSAVTGRAEIMDAPAPGGLGGTYAGNPVAVAAAHAVIEIMQEEQLPARGAKLGKILMDRLNQLKPSVANIAEIRGQGAMVAIEFCKPGEPLTPDADFTKRVQANALAKGLILLTCGVNANVVRFLFPLTVESNVFNEALDIIDWSIRNA